MFGLPVMIQNIIWIILYLLFLVSTTRTLPNHLDLNPTSSLLTLLAAWFALIVIHELGHALAGWWRGFTLLSLSVGPLLIQDGRLSLRGLSGEYAGYVLMCPPQNAEPRDWIIFYLGGSVLNLLTVPLVSWAAWHLPDWPSLFCVLLAQFSPLVALANLVLIRRGFADGVQVRALLPGAPHREVVSAVHRLRGYMLRSVPPTEWPADAVTLLRTSVDLKPQNELIALATLTELDTWNVSGTPDTAHLQADLHRLAALEHQMQHLSPAEVQLWHFYQAEVQLALNDQAGAEQHYIWLSECKVKRIDPLPLAVLYCKLLWARGEYEQARTDVQTILRWPVGCVERFGALKLHHFIDTVALKD